MTVCANCSRELQPQWKYCIFCGTSTAVIRAEDIPADEPPATPSAIRPSSTTVPQRVNVLAVLALILGCLASPLAALFGHLALSQISHSGERGTAIAWVAVVLGYLSLAALLVFVIAVIVVNR